MNAAIEYFRRCRLEAFYLLVIIPSGLLLIFLDKNPSVNDYHAHWSRAKQIASGQLLSQPSSDSRYFGQYDATGTFHAFNHTAVNSPFAYFPSWFGGGNFKISCILTLVICSIITVFAIRIGGVLRYPLAAIALLPSYFIPLTAPTADAVSNSIALLFISYSIRSSRKKQLTWWNILWLTILALLIGQLKVTLICLLLLLILVGAKKTNHLLKFDWRVLIPSLGGILSLLGWTYCIRRISPTIMLSLQEYHNRRTAVMKQPVSTLKSLLKTLLKPLDLIPGSGVIGRRMELFTGTEYTQLTPIVMVPILVACVLLFLKFLSVRDDLPVRYTAIGWIICGGYYCLTVIAMLSISQFASGEAADGMQARYLIPVLPLFSFMVPDLEVKISQNKINKWIAVLVVFSYSGLLIAHLAFAPVGLNNF